MKPIIESYESGTGDRFDVSYLFSYEFSWEGEFRHILKITSSIQFFCDLNSFEMAKEEITPLYDEE